MPPAAAVLRLYVKSPNFMPSNHVRPTIWLPPNAVKVTPSVEYAKEICEAALMLAFK